MALSSSSTSLSRILQRDPTLFRRQNVVKQFWKGIATQTSSHYRQQHGSPTSSLLQQSSVWPATGSFKSSICSNLTTIRSFATDETGKGGNDDNNNNNTDIALSSPMDHQDKDITASPIESTEYSPEDVMKTFQDTSYVYHPIDESFGTSNKFADMSNEELMDNSTIPGWDYLIHSPPIDKSAIPKGALVGTVVSTKMQKTINVAVDRFKIHKKYHKRMRYTRKFMAHDEQEVARDGDTVLIVPCQRISKNKHFMMREIVRAKGQL
jgi:small subunit ribosomal protein S17